MRVHDPLELLSEAVTPTCEIVLQAPGGRNWPGTQLAEL